MYKVLLSMLISAIWCSTVLAGNLDMTHFIGTWEVDYDRTMQEAKNSPKYDKTMAEQMPAMIKRMMTKIKIRITDKEMIYLQGTKEMALPYSVISASSNSVKVSMKQGSEGISVVFIPIDGQGMNFKSSASDDMHYYVWKKYAEKK